MSFDSNGRASGLFHVESCEFKDVLPIWERELWPARKSAIETNSAMKWLGGIDLDLMTATPTFWRVFYTKDANSRIAADQSPTKQTAGQKRGQTAGQSLGPILGPDVGQTVGQVVGVLSGHFGGVIDASNLALTQGEKSYRTRGLWVSREARRSGVAKLLMTAAFAQARREGCSAVWTFPRESSMPFYSSMGFTQIGTMIGVNDPLAGEFGPNCYAIAKL